MSAVLACLTALVLLVSGCGSVVRGKAELPGPGEHEKIPHGKDRDEAAVVAALRDIDACQLLDPAAAKGIGMAKQTLIPKGAHSCVITQEDDPLFADGIEAKVGEDFDFIRKYDSASLTLGGARAYQSESAGDCEIALPVSFQLAINFKGDTGYTCDRMRPVVEAAAKKLANPDALRVDPAKRPFAEWDGCLAIGNAMGKQQAQGYTFKPDGIYDPLSGCSFGKDDPKSSEPDYELEGRYDLWDPDPEFDTMTSVGGKTAITDDIAGDCQLEWAQGPTGAPEGQETLVFKLRAGDCAQTKALAERFIATIASKPNDPTRPQRPLLYGKQENDTGAPGACQDFSQGKDEACQPAQLVRIPEDKQSVLAGANRDRNVNCSLFADAIKREFGPELRPITWASHCVFVQPSHELEITVDVSAAYPPAKYGEFGSVYSGQRTEELGGKQAKTFFDSQHHEFDAYASPHNDINRQGMVGIQVERDKPVGKDAGEQPRIEDSTVQHAKQAMSQVMRQYFS